MAPSDATTPEFAPGLYVVLTFEAPLGAEVDGESLPRSLDNSPGTPLEQTERNLAALPVERHEIVHIADGGAFHLLYGEIRVHRQPGGSQFQRPCDGCGRDPGQSSPKRFS